MLQHKARFPIAILDTPVVFVNKARYPIAVLNVPVVLPDKALLPAAKLLPPVEEELKFVVEPIEMFEATFPPPVLINKLLIVPFEPVVLIEPVTLNEPDKDISYAFIPVNASIDWVTWYASTVPPVVIPVLFKVLAIYIFVINM